MQKVVKKMKDEIFDTAVAELTQAGKDCIHVLVQDMKEWVRKRYISIKSDSTIDSEVELEDLERRIAISNETVEIGMEKKELAVMWAMRKLGYSEEETQKILNLANEAYKF